MEFSYTSVAFHVIVLNYAQGLPRFTIPYTAFITQNFQKVTNEKVHPRTQISRELRLTVRSVRMKIATSHFKEL